MNRKNIAMLVGVLEALKAAAEASGGVNREPGSEDVEDTDTRFDDMRNLMKRAATDATYFKRFPEELHGPMTEIVHPPTATSEALMIACIWVAKLDEQLEDARREVCIMGQRSTTMKAQLDGQRDRMNAMDQTTEDHSLNAADIHGRLNAAMERIESLEVLVLGGAKSESKSVTDIGTKRSDNV